LRLGQVRLRAQEPALPLQQEFALRIVVKYLSGGRDVSPCQDIVRQWSAIGTLPNKHVVPATFIVRR